LTLDESSADLLRDPFISHEGNKKRRKITKSNRSALSLQRIELMLRARKNDMVLFGQCSYLPFLNL
jgi:hypothetical protein